MTALIMLLLSTLVLGLFASLAGAEFQRLRHEQAAVQLESLRDAALAHGLALAGAGQVAPGRTVEFRQAFAGGDIYGSVSELTGRPRPPGKGLYLVRATGALGPRRWAAQVQLNTVAEPPRVSGWSPVAAY